MELDDSRFELQSIERNYSWTIYHYARSHRKCHSTDPWNLLHSSNNTPEWPTFKPQREQMEMKCSLMKTLPSHGEFTSNIWNTHQCKGSQRGHLRWHSEWEDIFIVIWKSEPAWKAHLTKNHISSNKSLSKKALIHCYLPCVFSFNQTIPPCIWT